MYVICKPLVARLNSSVWLRNNHRQYLPELEEPHQSTGVHHLRFPRFGVAPPVDVMDSHTLALPLELG